MANRTLFPAYPKTPGAFLDKLGFFRTFPRHTREFAVERTETRRQAVPGEKS